jgi:stage II sporulation protein D
MRINGSAAQPKISVGIIDRSTHVTGRLEGKFHSEQFTSLSGNFSAKAAGGICLLFDQAGHEVARAPEVRLSAGGGAPFRLFNVTIGNQFHWQRTEEQVFRGDLILIARHDGTITAVNEVPLEEYLASVISSEMRATAPKEFLKAHAISSRSWLLAALQRKNKSEEVPAHASSTAEKKDEVMRWYDREEHDLFDVCADDHCQRYQGISKIISGQAEAAASETEGTVILYGDEICDARYSKVCGGLTEESDTAWSDTKVPYLASIADGAVPFDGIRTEEEAVQWILSEPHGYCNTKDAALLETILPEIDRETENFFRWTIVYPAGELAEILREKSGFDFGRLKEIVPLRRGPSGRTSRLKIVGSKMTMVVGKELEIRRWLSRSHLYSSAFIVTVERNHRGEPETFIFRGAGWGHGVGLCQVGAAVMASQGFSAEEILKHYFQGVEIRKIY